LFLNFFKIRVVYETGCFFTLRDPAIPDLICSPHIIPVMKTEEHSSCHLSLLFNRKFSEPDPHRDDPVLALQSLGKGQVHRLLRVSPT
jgi:hypothetical protein